MSRFFKEQGQGFRAPDVTPEGAVQIDMGGKKKKSMDDEAQEPVRKTEGGRYADVDYSDLTKAWS